jgi:DNA-binding ferritin-like protein (Dps family)
MANFISKLIATVIGEKGRWRDYKSRTRRLPPSYRTAIEAIERYLMYAGPGGDGESGNTMFEDLIELFEQSAASGTPVREIVGDDPIEFIEAFARNYPLGQWRIKERERLRAAIERAATEDTGKDGKAK